MNTHLLYKNKRWLRTLRYFQQLSKHKISLSYTDFFTAKRETTNSPANLRTFLQGWLILFCLLFLLLSFSSFVSKQLAPHFSFEQFLFLYQNPIINENTSSSHLLR
ncbi:hypothetical protein [Beggiatoa leptomitoformis]|uniref:Uncharacterized protein n=1 Tax=Beggiatoa leptomitoformis TaxID=288004 RepID=A0A2N9YCG4_9GAMM|nr:hypothetical protein [Beggiatoa leptomitoformis]ALG66546.1 hypothetical protein AL038_00835 [Beggiatoa leptomitoformis]AUI68155.1 hypothetical protein BLE401_05210 [Beggiatoa leptomitoformis]